MAVTEYYGCRVTLGYIATDAPLLGRDYRYSTYTQNRRGDCSLCQTACPCGAIRNGQRDSRRCNLYRETPDNQLHFSKYSRAKCDMCMRVCPLGKKAGWDTQQLTWPEILASGRLMN